MLWTAQVSSCWVGSASVRANEKVLVNKCQGSRCYVTRLVTEPRGTDHLNLLSTRSQSRRNWLGTQTRPSHHRSPEANLSRNRNPQFSPPRLILTSSLTLPYCPPPCSLVFVGRMKNRDQAESWKRAIETARAHVRSSPKPALDLRGSERVFVLHCRYSALVEGLRPCNATRPAKAGGVRQ